MKEGWPNRRGENRSGWDDVVLRRNWLETIIYFQQSRHTQRPKKFSPPDCGTTLYKYTLTGAYSVICTSVHVRSPREWTHRRQLVSDCLIASFRLFFDSFLLSREEISIPFYSRVLQPQIAFVTLGSRRRDYRPYGLSRDYQHLNPPSRH